MRRAGKLAVLGLVIGALGLRATATEASTTAPLSPLHTIGGARPAIVDAAGREVLLRGTNVNAIGDYFQADPNLPSTEPMTDTDWDEYAAQGFSVVRLIVSWSSLEPQRGVFDDAYLARVRDAVDEATSRGVYVVIDMHQDAWGKYIATPPGVDCDATTERAIGWDGAPDWATITDGASTCRVPGVRELSGAVTTSFANFYNDRDGIAQEFTRTWAWLADAFANDPGVAGYDLLNEPNLVEDASLNTQHWTDIIVRTVTAMRSAERAAGGFEHIAFVEPIVLFPLPGTVPTDAFSQLRNVVFAPHNYAESLNGFFPIETEMEIDHATGRSLGAPTWIGEHGFWNTAPDTLAKLRRYAAAEDRARVGGAWWQWRQACGDPHSIGHFGGTPGDQIQYRTMRCPSRVDAGVTQEFAQVLARAYPRATPGRLEFLRSDPDARTLLLAGRVHPARSTGPLVVWVPDAGKGAPHVRAVGLDDVHVDAVPGGYLVTAAPTSSTYQLRVR